MFFKTQVQPKEEDVESGYLKSKKRAEERKREKEREKEEKIPSKKKKEKKKKGEEEVPAQSGGCFTRCCWLIVILSVLSIPLALNFETIKTLAFALILPSSPYGSSVFSTEEEFFPSSPSDNEIVGTQVLGASKDEVIGYIKAGKNCCSFYSGDPSKNDQVLGTRICPEFHDSDVNIHMRGIFGFHPNMNMTLERFPKIQYIVTGSNVWVTFYDQHNATRQTYTVPPGYEVAVPKLVGTADETLPGISSFVYLCF